MNKKAGHNKLISLAAAAECVEDGALLAIGGMTLYRRPVAFVRALINRYRQTGAPRQLTLLAFTGGFECDLLIGAGMVRQVRSCYFGLESFGFAPMFTYYANRGEIEVLEETEASLSSSLRAQISGVGFIPARAWLGTDLPRLRPDLRTVTDPYSGEELMAFPAIQPDVAVIHALQADPDGNADIGRNRSADEELTLASRQVIVTAEEIVPELTRADLAGPFVSAVVHAPYGAQPSSCHPCYPYDGQAILSYIEGVSNPESYQAYIESWLSKP